MDPTPADSDDNWPPESVGPEKHLHALGVISAYYNLYEETLQFLFGYHIERPDVAEFLFRRQNNAERLATIRFSFNQHEKDPNVLDHIEYLITHYSICHDNRNILMHSRHSGSSPGEAILSLEKTSKAKDAVSKLAYYKLSLKELRQVADSIMLGFHYALNIWHHLRLRDHPMPDVTRPLPKLPSHPTLILPPAAYALTPSLETHERLLRPLPGKPPIPAALNPS